MGQQPCKAEGLLALVVGTEISASVMRRHHALPDVKPDNLSQVQSDDPRCRESWTGFYAYRRKRGEEASLFAGNVLSAKERNAIGL